MTTTDPIFDLDAGIVCLDFVNTLSSTSGEHLNTYFDLLAFAQQSALLTQAEADRLRAHALRSPGAADTVVQHARLLRTTLRRIFSAIAADERPHDGDVDHLNHELALAMKHACLELRGDGFAWQWTGEELERPLWPIARSAADLLTSDSVRRLVRECGASDCRWLFLDSSKNRTRQWCSMSSCGNREKARRHYQRQKARRAQSA